VVNKKTKNEMKTKNKMKALWQKLIYAGVDTSTPSFHVISLISTNIALFLLFFISSLWFFLSQLVPGLGSLTIVHLIVAALTLAHIIAMHHWNSRFIRFSTALLMVGYFSLINLSLGFYTAVEFYAAPILFLVLIMLPAEGDKLAAPYRLFLFSVLITTFIAMSVIEPVVAVTPDMQFIGYRLTILIVLVCCWFLSAVYGLQVRQLIGSLNREKSTTYKALLESEGRYRRAARLTNMGHWIWDEIEDKCIYCSEELAEIFGVSVDEYLKRGSTWEGDLEWIHPDDLVHYESVVFGACDDNKGYEIQCRIIRGDGQVRHLHEVADAVLDSEGKILQTVGVLRDVTESSLAEEALRRAQKMDAVGQLTGGIAHDFNNIIGIILGNVELLELQMKSEMEGSERLGTIRKSAERAAVLTRRLLSFSQIQPVETSVTNINRLLRGIEGLIERSLTPEVSVEYYLERGLRSTEVNHGDFEDSLINLVLNSRDAMPGGGKLRLETHNCSFDEEYCNEHPEFFPGDYVELIVSDSGTGIPEKDMEHLLEPFFTTKEAGKGTGLGLAMVYGFVNRSAGHLDVESEEGSGTTVRLYFPALEGQNQIAGAESETEHLLPRGTETLLIVDDEPEILELAKTKLQKLGYDVHSANSGAEGLLYLEQHANIDLLFSDVIMPGGLDGYALAEKALSKFPRLKVLLTSGYSGRAYGGKYQSRFAANLMDKPYSETELANRVRSALDA
jgi:PAS domain S-box-containing protein